MFRYKDMIENIKKNMRELCPDIREYTVDFLAHRILDDLLEEIGNRLLNGEKILFKKLFVLELSVRRVKSGLTNKIENTPFLKTRLSRLLKARRSDN